MKKRGGRLGREEEARGRMKKYVRKDKRGACKDVKKYKEHGRKLRVGREREGKDNGIR